MMGLEVDELRGQQRMRVPILPMRQAAMANGLLTEIAVEVLDQAAIAVKWVPEREFTEVEQQRGNRIVEAIEKLGAEYFEGTSEVVDGTEH